LARVRLLPIRAAASEEAGEEFVKQAEEVLNDLKAKVSFGQSMRCSKGRCQVCYW